MAKIGIAVGGNSGIDYLEHDPEIRIFRSLLVIENQEYEDFVEITSDDFYDRITKNPDLDIHTAQISTGSLVEMYQEMIDSGYDELIIITISRHLSGTYQNAVLAAKMIPDTPIHVFDTHSVAYVQALIGKRAKELADQGVPAQDILKELEYFRDHNHIFVTVDTLKYLVKNGRLSNAQGFLGTLLKLKPLLHVSKDGKVETLDKIRTTSKARDVMVNHLLKEIEGKTVELFILYTNNMAEMIDYKEELLKHEGITQITLVPLTPVVGCHAGPGTIGVGYIEVK